ncbi:Type I restriction-modification system, specificity subunit S [Methanosarcina siciliae C2J]|uniref:Type I restriction-modification system, specificity subunit S n=1 Tax=Methanosarcina siciliae C2J TaxID=1434118 RepID=A0A0E3PPN0_9EURY|nr:restriction endonuclease subunit S [Methanosarcina siciliae]AKB36522.1 Type I restriction-modification system, specificity subunit S [Methanosarcina siciliae C2J]
MQQKSELPEGWEFVSFEDILEINPSKPPKDIVSPETPVTFVPMPAVDAISGEITDPEIRPFSEVRKGYTAFQNDDVIFAKITPCMENGKAAIARNLLNNLGFGSTEYIVFRSKGAILPEYLYHYIRQESYRKLAESNMTGSVGQKRVPKDFVQNSMIPLPPLPEQHRIVSAIEALFARLDAANEKLDRVPGILKKFRESVLAAAFEGRLTEEWRVECAGDIEWNWQNINEIGVVSGGLTKNQKRLNYSIKLPYLRVANVYANRLELDEMKEIGVLEDEINRYLLEEGDLLVVEGNGSIDQIGRVALWDGSIKPCLHQNHIIKVRFSQDVYNKYVLYWLLSPIGRENITLSSSSTSGLNTLSISKVGNLPIPLPPLPEQQEIVRRIDALFAFADSIETKVTAAREKTEKLRQSILAKAFSGELVETEAEIARREGRDYETAEVLLEKIKAEKKISKKK